MENKPKKRKHRPLNLIPKTVHEKIEAIPENYPKPLFLPTLLDIIYCRTRYGAGIGDYFDFRFYSLNKIGRKSFGTVRDQFNLYKTLNNKDYIIRTANKNEFAKYYSHFMKRETLTISSHTEKSELQDFLKRAKERGIQRLIFKPYRGNSGYGVFILDVDNPKLNDLEALLAESKKTIENSMAESPQLKESFLAQTELIAEWVLENHEAIKKIHPASLNTLRIPTLRKKTGCAITGAFIRFGRDGKPVDNISSGGMVAEVDLDSGIVISPAVDHAGKEYYVHPSTNETIIGLKIPFWDCAKKLVLEAAEITPELRYTSWDVAITPDGPVLIEGNSLGGLEIQQMPRHMGKRYMYEEVLREAGKW